MRSNREDAVVLFEAFREVACGVVGQVEAGILLVVRVASNFCVLKERARAFRAAQDMTNHRFVEAERSAGLLIAMCKQLKHRCIDQREVFVHSALEV